ncbi:MAG: hypothetical protein U0990_00135 [Candidatus Nanopelagicales bacterium]|nr:hypothetical protein [Candidatus Nanopelagicales bacterium]MDZ4248482.1 hypothetical protein [Candidatus Nanopelagicales bacterium]
MTDGYTYYDRVWGASPTWLIRVREDADVDDFMEFYESGRWVPASDQYYAGLYSGEYRPISMTDVAKLMADLGAPIAAVRTA